MNEIVQFVTLKPAPGKGDELRQKLAKLARLSRGDAGCITYDVYSGPDESYRVIEVWCDDKALDEHIKAPHTASALQAFGQLLGEPARVEACTALSVAALNEPSG